MSRELSCIQPCAVCSAAIRCPVGSDAEYAIVLPSAPASVHRRGAVTIVGPSPCYLVCEECVGRLMGRWGAGKATNPGGVSEALRERYGDGYLVWTSPKSLPSMLDEAAAYLASPEARDGTDFGTWQKMRDWI